MSEFGSTTPVTWSAATAKTLLRAPRIQGSTVIGLASTAPVYSLVATLGFVVLAVGAQAPIAFVIAFVPMLFIAFAYRELNNEIPDCGTTFTWGTKAFGPWVGWMGGWGVAVAGMVVLAKTWHRSPRCTSGTCSASASPTTTGASSSSPSSSSRR